VRGEWYTTGGGGGGGGLVLLVTAGVILLGSGAAAEVATALVEAVIALAVTVLLCVAGLGAFLVYRARRDGYSPAVREVAAPVIVHQVHAPGRPAISADRAAIEAPPVRLHPDDLAELAAILRRSESSNNRERRDEHDL
jgi:hypothetical protein